MPVIKSVMHWMENLFNYYYIFNLTLLTTLSFLSLLLDAEPVLRVLLVQIVRIRRHDIFRFAQEKVADHVAAPVPSLADAHRGVHLGPIPCR